MAIAHNISKTAFLQEGTEQRIQTSDGPICQKIVESEDLNISVWVFMIGIITARFGKYEFLGEVIYFCDTLFIFFYLGMLLF